MTNHILLLSGNHLCDNPRVVKEADAFAEVGLQVEVLGLNSDPLRQERDSLLLSEKKWKFTGLMTGQRAIEKNWHRTIRLVAKIMYQTLGLENRWQLGPMAEALLKEGGKRMADLYIAHSEPGMWAAEQLRLQGRRVGVDMEDWFSEDLLPEARRNRPIRLLKKLERNLLNRGVYSSCTSEAMADALVKEYGCRRPVVIRNVFPLKDREGLDGMWRDRPEMARWLEKNDPTAKRPSQAPVSIHWYSQTVGPGRGLEELFQALDGLGGNWELHLRGNISGYEKWLQESCPKYVLGKLKLHPQVGNEELLSRIAEHDIGYAGEQKEPASRNLTITNKFFQYLQGGLAIIASDTEGQREGALLALGGAEIITGSAPGAIRKALESFISDHDKLRESKKQSWAAGSRLCWENESERYRALAVVLQ